MIKEEKQLLMGTNEKKKKCKDCSFCQYAPWSNRHYCQMKIQLYGSYSFKKVCTTLKTEACEHFIER